MQCSRKLPRFPASLFAISAQSVPSFPLCLSNLIFLESLAITVNKPHNVLRYFEETHHLLTYCWACTVDSVGDVQNQWQAQHCTSSLSNCGLARQACLQGPQLTADKPQATSSFTPFSPYSQYINLSAATNLPHPKLPHSKHFY